MVVTVGTLWMQLKFGYRTAFRFKIVAVQDVKSDIYFIKHI